MKQPADPGFGRSPAKTQEPPSLPHPCLFLTTHCRCTTYYRTHLYVPVPDAAAAAKGRRVAWCTDEHSRRRLIVIEGERGLPPGLAGGPGSGARLRRAGQPQPYVVEKLAAVLQRALRIDPATAAFYVAEAKCDVRVAIERVGRWPLGRLGAGCSCRATLLHSHWGRRLLLLTLTTSLRFAAAFQLPP